MTMEVVVFFLDGLLAGLVIGFVIGVKLEHYVNYRRNQMTQKPDGKRSGKVD